MKTDLDNAQVMPRLNIADRVWSVIYPSVGILIDVVPKPLSILAPRNKTAPALTRVVDRFLLCLYTAQWVAAIIRGGALSVRFVR